MARKKDFDYFEHFYSTSKSATQAAKFLEKSLKNFDYDTVEDKLKELHHIENEADLQKHEMTRRLLHEFITPLEREDIIDLANQLDDVIDAIEDIWQLVFMFNLKEVRPEILEFAELIVKCCEALESEVDEFRHFKTSKIMREKIIAVNALESEGDVRHMKIMRELFKSEATEKDLIIWKEIYLTLEKCLDECEDVSDAIESIIMKNT